MLRRLNPFARLPNPREVFSWGMYDLANQSFQLLINTLLFSIFVQNVIVIDNPARGRSLWSMMVAASLLLVVMLSAPLGALADQKAWKREVLIATGAICALFTGALAILQPGQVPLAIALYLVAALACGLGENFLGSFLPEISTPRNVGFVSALGWTMSYVGALLLLGIVALYAFVLHRAEPAQARPMFVLAGVWFALGMVPSVLFLRERATPQAGTIRSAFTGAFGRLFATAREARHYRHLARFLGAFFVYSMGTQTMIFFLGIIAIDLGFTLGPMVVLSLVIALTAGISSGVVARVQDRVGHVRTVSFFLVAWIVATLAIAGAKYLQVGMVGYLVVAGLIGLGLGGVGTASRAVVGAFTPDARAGEFFGLWGAVYKLSGIAGALAFGVVSARVGVAPALLFVAAYFALGLALLAWVNEREGIAAANLPPAHP